MANPKQLENLATILGLERLFAINPDGFAVAQRAARELVTRQPRPETLDQEPAHSYRFDVDASRSLPDTDQ